jgi:hypothetical protein
MARGLVAFGGAMLTTLDFVAGLVEVRDMTLSFRFGEGSSSAGCRRRSSRVRFFWAGFSPGAESPEGGSGAGAKRPGAVPNRRRFALAKRGLQRPATGPHRTRPRGAAPASTCEKLRAKRKDRAFTVRQACNDIRPTEIPA